MGISRLRQRLVCLLLMGRRRSSVAIVLCRIAGLSWLAERVVRR